MKNKVVIFSDDGSARVLVNPPNIAELVGRGGLLNPDLSAVRGISPSYWKEHKGKLVPNHKKMTEPEKYQHKPSLSEKIKQWLKL